MSVPSLLLRINVPSGRDNKQMAAAPRVRSTTIHTFLSMSVRHGVVEGEEREGAEKHTDSPQEAQERSGEHACASKQQQCVCVARIGSPVPQKNIFRCMFLRLA